MPFEGELLRAKLLFAEVINLTGAGKDFGTADESPQQLGCVPKLSFYIKQNQQSHFSPPRCSSNSQRRFLRYPKFYITYHSRHTLTLLMKVNIIPIYRGKSWRWIPGLLSKVWTCSYKTTAAWLPTQRHTNTPGSTNTGEHEQKQSEITSTDRPIFVSEKRYGSYTYQSVLSVQSIRFYFVRSLGFFNCYFAQAYSAQNTSKP